MKHTIMLLLAAVFSLAACRKKDDPVVVNNPPVTTPDTGLAKLKITIQNVAGATPLVLDLGKYVTANGDTLQVNALKYYISNIVLHTDSMQFTEPESYYLIDEADNNSKSWTIDSIPPGTYNKISFLIGVDVRRNTTGAQTGALDPSHGMFWDWNSGYIMAKLEGTSPSAGTPMNRISYHIAGFRGDQSAIREVTITLPQPIAVKASATKNIHLRADVLEWFKSPTLIKIADLPSISSIGPEAVQMSVNYADMFTVDHID